MTLYQSYLIEYSRVITGIVLESRKLIAATVGKSGFAVEAFCNMEAEKVTDNVIPYKLETAQGNLAAYFSLIVNGNLTTQYQLFIRPAFEQFSIEIQQFINIFISSNEWQTDILTGELKD